MSSRDREIASDSHRQGVNTMTSKFIAAVAAFFFVACGGASDSSSQVTLAERAAALKVAGSTAIADGNLRIGNDGSTLAAFDVCAFRGIGAPPGEKIPGAVAGLPLARAQLGITGGIKQGEISAPLKVDAADDAGLFLVDPSTTDCATAIPIHKENQVYELGGAGTPIPSAQAETAGGHGTLMLLATKSDSFFWTTGDPSRVVIGKFPYD
jgi:hypothetical protein